MKKAAPYIIFIKFLMTDLQSIIETGHFVTRTHPGNYPEVLLKCFNWACWVGIRESAQFYRVN
jgi:hypothetical protein